MSQTKHCVDCRIVNILGVISQDCLALNCCVDRGFTDYSYLGLFVPWTIRTIDGLFLPWTVRTVDCSYPPGLFVPWTVRTVPGRFVPCWERQHSVSQKKSPCGFLTFFPKRLGIFRPNITGLLYVYTYGRLQIFIQLSPIVTNLYHIKCDYQRAFRPMVDISSI